MESTRTVISTNTNGRTIKERLKHVGYLGKSGGFYSLDENPTELIQPVWYTYTVDFVEDSNPQNEALAPIPTTELRGIALADLAIEKWERGEFSNLNFGMTVGILAGLGGLEVTPSGIWVDDIQYLSFKPSRDSEEFSTKLGSLLAILLNVYARDELTTLLIRHIAELDADSLSLVRDTIEYIKNI